MNIAIFGGTFDPIHTGHLLMAESAREQFKLQRIVFLPTGNPPHKQTIMASAMHRLAMIKKAIQSNPAFEASIWEIQQKRTVYTYEALAHFKKVYPRAALFFILGSDSLRAVPQWRQGIALLRQARFLIIERPETPWAGLPLTLRRWTRRVNSPLCAIASHEIRARRARRQSIRYVVPDPVAAYIQKKNLYSGISR